MYDGAGVGAVWQEGLLAERARGMTSSVIRDLLALTSRPEVISLAGGLPDSAALPAQWLRSCADALLEREGPSLLQYSTTEGDPELRETEMRQVFAEAVADRLRRESRGQRRELVAVRREAHEAGKRRDPGP